MGWALSLIPRAVLAGIAQAFSKDEKPLQGWDADALAAGAEREMSRED